MREIKIKKQKLIQSIISFHESLFFYSVFSFQTNSSIVNSSLLIHLG